MNEATQKVLSRLNSVREMIACGSEASMPDMELTDKMYVNVHNQPEFRSRTVFLAVMANVLNFAKSPDFDAVTTALREDPEAAETFANSLDGLKIDVRFFQEYYIPYVDTIETFKPVDKSREALFALLEDVYATGDVKDARALFNAIASFVKTNVALADDVYRDDFVGKTMELPTFDSDEPMTWPDPCESELNGHLPSPDERLKDDLSWLTWELDVSRMVPHTEDEICPVLVKDVVSRLWGKAKRLVDGIDVSNKIRAQMPRWVMYPFYDELFHLTRNIAWAILDYLNGHLGPVTGSTAIKSSGSPALCASIKSPCDRIKLPWFLEQLLFFAPREYFTSQCNHYAYMKLSISLFIQTLDGLCKAFTDIDTRDIARDVMAIKDGFRVFHAALAQSPQCTRREYKARVKEIIDPIKTALNRLSDDLFAIECEMQKVKPDPKKVRKGIKHERTRVSARQAAEWAGVSVSTIRRLWKNPKCGLPRPPLNDTTNPEKALHEWGKLYRANANAKHEANMIEHATPTGSLSKGTRRKIGI